MPIDINIEHSVAHVHTKNGLAESLIKRLQLIARPLLMKTKLPASTWGHAIMHVASLIRIRPTSYHEYSPSQLVLGTQPNISYLRIFGCAVYVPIAPTQRTKLGPQRRIGIYVGFDSSSIIKYLEPMTGNVFRARFDDCHFNETVFPQLGGGGGKSIPEGRHEITWNASTLSHLDQRINQCELEVQMIIHLQNLANQLPDAFVDTKKVTKSHIPATNVPARVDITEGQKAFESKTSSKRGRPIGSKDITPRKRRTNGKQNDHEESNIENQIPEEIQNEQIAPEEVQVPENNEISISYVHRGEKWDRNNFDVNNIFAFQVALDIIQNDDDPEPQNTNECRQRNDWPKWREAMQAKLHSLIK